MSRSASVETAAPGGAARTQIGIAALVASAGGLPALSAVLGALPRDLPVPVVVLEHLQPHRPSVLARILALRTALRVKEAEDGEALEPGVVYVAPPDAHVLVSGGRIVLDGRAPIGHLRPRGDLLLSSLAAYGDGAIAAVLSGTGDDGAAGAVALKAAGGTVIVEDPGSAMFAGMPAAAVATGVADAVLPLDEIGAAIAGLVRGGAAA